MIAMGLVAWVLVAPAEGAGQACAATPLLAEVEAKVPPGEATRKLRAWLGYARNETLAAEREGDAARCDAVVRELGARAGQIEAVAGKGAADRVRVEADRVRAEEAARAAAAAPPPPPPPTPEEQWQRRRRRLIGHVTASAFFTLVGLTLSTVPWIVIRASDSTEDGGVIGAIIMTEVGAPVFVAAGIPLAVWSVRLHRHRDQRPVVARLGGAGLRFEF